VWDVPRAMSATAKYNAILFSLSNFDAGSEYCLGNIRMAVGAPDTRNKLVTEGKWVTHGPVRREQPPSEARIVRSAEGDQQRTHRECGYQGAIVGHTDSDGDAAQNLDLSKRRAAAVRIVLMTQFRIDGARLTTDGKGETQPIDKNETATGKANNRRVEFVKM
jgi:OmpA-OmpF porin, OOP family